MRKRLGVEPSYCCFPCLLPSFLIVGEIGRKNKEDERVKSSVRQGVFLRPVIPKPGLDVLIFANFREDVSSVVPSPFSRPSSRTGRRETEKGERNKKTYK